jgi:hypothetical protein
MAMQSRDRKNENAKQAGPRAQFEVGPGTMLGGAATHQIAAQFGAVEVVAKILDVSVSYLNKARMGGDGPPFHKFGHAVRYHIPSVIEWANSQMRRSTSDPGEATISKATASKNSASDVDGTNADRDALINPPQRGDDLNSRAAKAGVG